MNATIEKMLGSAAAASLVTALFTKSIADKNVRIQSITEERRKWRDKIRDIVAEVNAICLGEGPSSEKASVLEAELRVRLNPSDDDDNAIVKCLEDIIESKSTKRLAEFNKRTAIMLKHDWDRAKIEVGRTPPFSVIALETAFVLVLAIAVLMWYEHVYPALGFGCKSAIHLFAFIAVSMGLRLAFCHFIAEKIKCMRGKGDLGDDDFERHCRVRCASSIAAFFNKPFRDPYCPDKERNE